MKTIEAIKKEIRGIMDEIMGLNSQGDDRTLPLRKRLRGKLPQLRQYILYLETNPTTEFCQQEVVRLSLRIKEIMKSYVGLPEDDFLKSVITAHKKKFEK